METTKNIDTAVFWNQVLERVREVLGNSSHYATWFKNTTLSSINIENKLIVINVDNELIRNYIETKHKTLLLTEINKILPKIKLIKFNIVKRKSSSVSTKTSKKQINTIPFSFDVVNSMTGLSSKFTFDNLINAPYIQFGVASANAIIKKPGIAYNPLFLYGKSGVGKTHLIQALGNYLNSLYKDLRIKYVEAEQFTSEFVEAISENKVDVFRKRYQNYQVLIIDDVHFFAGKDRTVIELFHLFNSLTNNNWQIIFSSDRRPGEIEGLQDRMKTRFYSGMTIEIPDPGKEDLRIIFIEKARQMGLLIEDAEIIDYIIENVDKNVREITGVLKNLQIFSEIEGKPLTLIGVKNFIKSNVKPKTKLSVKEILPKVAKYYDVQESLILGKTRKAEVVRARQVIMYLLREYLDWSYSTIGEKIGKKDHTTVMHACEKIDERLETDNVLQVDISKLKNLLNI